MVNHRNWEPPATDPQYPFLLLVTTFIISILTIGTMSFHEEEPVLVGVNLTTILGWAIVILALLMGYMLIRWNATYEQKVRAHFNVWAKLQHNLPAADYNIFIKLQSGAPVFVDGQKIILTKTSADTYFLVDAASGEELKRR